MRNSFERQAGAIIPARFAYESIRLAYTVEHTYLPDWYDPVSHTVIETKGYFDAATRRAMLAVLRCNPGLRLIMVFQRPETTISKRSRTTYRQWCERHGIEVMNLADLAGLTDS